MEDFFKKVIEGSGIIPPEVCTKAFTSNFSNAINVEWFRRESKYEAVFYQDNNEYIALFDISGNLEKYKMYLTNEFLPESIKQNMEVKGEIMNVVLINEGNHILYEVIIRDMQLKRFLILITQLGQIIEERQLLFQE